MRQITKDAVDAFMNEQVFSRGNTRVEVRPWQAPSPANSCVLLLHGSPIARFVCGQPVYTLEVCAGGWQTVTTKERLNGIPGVRVHQKDGVWYLNGEQWDGSWVCVGPRFEIKQVGDYFFVHYPRGTKRAPVEFANRQAAEAFAEVEASNLGVPYP